MARNKQEKKVFHNGGFYNYRPPFNGKKKPYFTLNFLRAIVRPFFKRLCHNKLLIFDEK